MSRTQTSTADLPGRGEGGCGTAGSARGKPSIAGRLVQATASLNTTLAGLALLLAASAIVYREALPAALVMPLPLALLSLNLIAAIATTPKLRVEPGLLVFHLSLLALVVLAALGRLTYLTGHLELADGVPFEGVLTGEQRGPLHFGRIDKVSFISEGFTIDYAAGIQRGATRNIVSWQDDEGRWERRVIGDQTPLVLEGYKFYTSFNKGFAPVFRWTPTLGAPLLGALHLPSYPANEVGQARTWSPPGSAEEVWLMLSINEVILDPERRSEFRLPENYHLVVRVGDLRHELRPGESLALSGGTLQFLDLRAWMGYSVFYDWTLPWLAAASFIAVASLCFHYRRKFADRPWDA